MACIRKRAPKASSAAVRHVMLENVGRETKPERKLRSLLFRSGLRFRKDYSPVPNERVTVDILFPRQRICIFVDGCFWHGCPLHFEIPKTHSSWWQEKIEDNRQRDARQTRLLTALGWTVIRMWEHEIKEDSISAKVRKIKEFVQQMAPPDSRKRRGHR
jgi:DNA mismatch endonuclease (patch repair protein)